MVGFFISLNALSPMCHPKANALTDRDTSQSVGIPGAPLPHSGWKPGPDRESGPGTDHPSESTVRLHWWHEGLCALGISLRVGGPGWFRFGARLADCRTLSPTQSEHAAVTQGSNQQKAASGDAPRGRALLGGRL